MNQPPHPKEGRVSRPLVLGVLGGIASGKSEVARLLAGPQGCVLAADTFAQEALDLPAVQAELLQEFGAAAVQVDGRTDRKYLAGQVFHDPKLRKKLEGWIHPLVRDKIRSGLREAKARAMERIVLDVPLLLENDAEHGFAQACDHLIFVETSTAERERRAREKRGWQAGEVLLREKAQWPLAEKRRRARFVVRNDGSRTELEAAVRQVLAELSNA